MQGWGGFDPERPADVRGRTGRSKASKAMRGAPATKAWPTFVTPRLLISDVDRADAFTEPDSS